MESIIQISLAEAIAVAMHNLYNSEISEHTWSSLHVFKCSANTGLNSALTCKG